ncbi:MAG: EamA family transporter [Thermoplasmatota archaeon]
MDRAKLPAAFAATYLLWGATFLGIRVAVETYPPFLTSAVRFALAGVLVFGVLAARGKLGATSQMPGWPKAIVTGALFCLGTHGIAPHVSRTVASGVVAVFMAATPLLMALLAHGAGQEKARPTVWLAVVLGLAGVAVLAWPAGDADVTVAEAAWMLLAALCWAIGSLLTKRWTPPGTPVAHFAGRQMVAGATLLWLASGVSGQGWVPPVPDLRTAVAVTYLAVGGTVAAYFSYLYLLRHVPLAQASSYTFVNPVVAVVLGAWLASEPLTPRLLAATPLVVAAVVLALRAKSPPRAPAAPPVQPPVRPPAAEWGPRPAPFSAAAASCPTCRAD